MENITLSNCILEKHAFYNNKNLKYINLIGVNLIENYAFENCTSLTKVYVPEKCKIKKYAFKGCNVELYFESEKLSEKSPTTFDGVSKIHLGVKKEDFERLK